MIRGILTAAAVLFTTTIACAEETGYLLCEYESTDGSGRWKIQNVPLFYDNDELVALGKPSHCLDEPQFYITETHATWRCVTAMDGNNKPARSIYVEIHRYTGRYHRNDFEGDYEVSSISDVWHGVCSPYRNAQF